VHFCQAPLVPTTAARRVNVFGQNLIDDAEYMTEQNRDEKLSEGQHQGAYFIAPHRRHRASSKRMLIE
jgi:hypothetical protein